MGLGTVRASGLFLTTAGGYIWNRKADESDPNYATQDFNRADGTVGVRKGARYADLSGVVKDVVFRTHKEYGQNINVTIESEGESYIFSIGTNNKYSQDMMKCLLKMDFTKPLFIKPYDFVGNDNKRAQGLSFRQGGVKIDLKGIEGMPTQDAEWFKTAGKKNIRRFFEDLSDWFVAEVEEKIVPKIAELRQTGSLATEETVEESTGDIPGLDDPNYKAPVESNEPDPKAEEGTPKALTPIKMKKALRAYIKENYGDETLPKGLKGEELVKWYNLSVEEEELPFEDFEAAEPVAAEKVANEVPKAELDSQLDALMPSK